MPIFNDYQREEFARHGDRNDLMSMQRTGEEPESTIRVPANTLSECAQILAEREARRPKSVDNTPMCHAFSHCCNARIVRIDAVRMNQEYAQHKCSKCEKLLTNYKFTR